MCRRGDEVYVRRIHVEAVQHAPEEQGHLGGLGADVGMASSSTTQRSLPRDCSSNIRSWVRTSMYSSIVELVTSTGAGFSRSAFLEICSAPARVCSWDGAVSGVSPL